MIYKYCPLHPVVCLMHIKYEKYVHFENIEHIENIKHIKGVYLVSGESEQVDNDREWAKWANWLDSTNHLC